MDTDDNKQTDTNQVTEPEAQTEDSTSEQPTQPETQPQQPAEEVPAEAAQQTEVSAAGEQTVEETPPAEETTPTETAPVEEAAEPTEESTAETAEPTEESASEEPAAQPKPSKNDNPNARWYVVHTYSGHENKVAAALKQRIESEGLENKIVDILVPMQDKIEIRSGRKATVKEKVFPGYILVKMVLDDISWLAVRTTQGVTSFVGIGNKPTPISDAEVATIIKFTQEEAPTFKQVFTVSDAVKIIDGPFAEFIGKVDAVDEEKGKLRVLVSIFGRETPVELDFLQVQKI